MDVEILWLRSRWYAEPDDLIGGWCIMETDQTPGESGKPGIAEFISERLAKHIAYLHNKWLDDCHDKLDEIMNEGG